MAEKDDEIRAIETRAEIISVKAQRNGLFQVVMELPEFAVDQAKIMMGWTRLDLRVLIEKDRIP